MGGGGSRNASNSNNSNAGTRQTQGRVSALTMDGAPNIDERVTSMYTDGIINQLDNLILGANASDRDQIGSSNAGDNVNVNMNGTVTSNAAMTLNRGGSNKQGG